MSRQVDLTKKLSDEDREYLKRRGRNWEIEANDLQFGDLEPGDVFQAADHSEPDGSFGQQKPSSQVTGLPPGADAGSGEELEKVTVAEVRKLNKGEQEDELRALGVEPIEGKAKEVEDQLIDILRDRGRLEE